MIEPEEIKEKRRRIINEIREYYTSRLGKYTHQRISDEWHFYGLGFIKDEMTYVFGFNAGFFKKEPIENQAYSHIGVNVLVRTNGTNPQLRSQYLKFFRHQLSSWITDVEKPYSTFRGGVGVEFPHYKPIDYFSSDIEIIQYIKNGIDGIANLYNIIAKNPDNIFDNVVCMIAPWNETIIDLAKKQIAKQ
ncbi:MAG: hypothetical protein MJ211_12390 [Bacteroidales bacterium]|nr:hypothetical protein [Bacteroidales bacterium]